MLLGAFAARVGDELLRLDEGKGIEEVVLIQCVLVALGDAGSAENAACVFFVLVEVLGGLETARFRRELVLRMEGGFYLFEARVFWIPVDDEVADHAEVAERLDRELVALIACREVVNQHLAGELGVAVDAHGACAADARTAGAGEGERRILLLLDVGQCAENSKSCGARHGERVHPRFALDIAMDFECCVHVNTSFPLADTS